jgi:hypothetical protein
MMNPAGNSDTISDDKDIQGDSRAYIPGGRGIRCALCCQEKAVVETK